MSKFTIAVIGCGRIANLSHFPAFEQMGNVRVKYACDLIEEKAQLIKDKYSFVEQVITDYHVALADPEVTAVYVLTPNFGHYSVTMDALRAGKHVFCEKPVTVNYALSCEMAKEAEKRGLLLNIGVVNRFNRSVELIKEMVEGGKLGNVYHVYCSFRSFRSIPGLGGPFTDKAQAGGGVLIDWGIHFLDLILYILGSPKLETVTCDAYNEMAKDMKSYKYHSMWAENTKNTETGVNDVEDFVTGYIRTSGAGISFNGAWAQNVEKDEMFVDFLGDKGGVRLDYGSQFLFTDGATLESKYTDHEIPAANVREDTAFLEATLTGEKTRIDVSYILESMRLLDSLYRSADAHRELRGEEI